MLEQVFGEFVDEGLWGEALGKRTEFGALFVSPGLEVIFETFGKSH